MQENSPVTLDNLPNSEIPKGLVWEGTFIEYINKCIEYPPTIRTAHQRFADALMSYGQEEYTFLREKVIRYNVFDDPFTPEHKNAIYGRNVDIALMKAMRIFKAAANRLGQEWRMYLLRGPVGTAKSTFANLAAAALEDYTKKPEGQLFAPYWVVDSGDEEGMEILGTLTRKFEKTRFDCPLHEEPLRILPIDTRTEILKFLNSTVLEKNIKTTFFTEGDSCPICASIYRRLMRRHKYDWKKVVENHLRVRRYPLSKASREGIVTARPKSEKDQDAAEFLGSPNYANLGAFGSKTDPRTFDFAGHYMAANRGILYYEEQLKFALQFLYDCLGATQEHRVQPSSFMEVTVDEVILGSTNEPEYQELKKNDKMEAIRDRMIVVDVPYILKLGDEVKIYQKFFGPEKRGGKHLAPRTLYLASYWGLLTRLEDSKKGNLKLRDKLKLYDGRQVEGFTEDAIKELKKESEREGMDGISPRYIHDKISAAFMREDDKSCVNFFTVMNELSEGLPHHQHIKSDEIRKKLEGMIALAKEELEERLEEDIQDAVTGGEEDLMELFGRYIDQITAYKMREKVRDPITQEMVDPDEQFMKSIEDKIGVTDYDDFRQKIVNQMQKRAWERQRDKNIPPFDFRTDERLYRALRLYLFDQVRERINWERLVSKKVTEKGATELTEAERLIDRIKTRLTEEKYGPEQESYCEVCAAEALVYYASVFVRRKNKK